MQKILRGTSAEKKEKLFKEAITQKLSAAHPLVKRRKLLRKVFSFPPDPQSSFKPFCIRFYLLAMQEDKTEYKEVLKKIGGLGERKNFSSKSSSFSPEDVPQTILGNCLFKKFSFFSADVPQTTFAITSSEI